MNLRDYHTPTLTGLNRRQLIREDQSELRLLVAMCAHAQAMPRRLGADATSDELAMDKKTAKRLAHCFRQSLQAWEGKEGAKGARGKEARRLAATVRWDRLAEDRRQYLLSRFAPYATLALDTDQKRWGYHILTLLNTELGWIDYAMR
jgi:hypothetical protein